MAKESWLLRNGHCLVQNNPAQQSSFAQLKLRGGAHRKGSCTKQLVTPVDCWIEFPTVNSHSCNADCSCRTLITQNRDQMSKWNLQQIDSRESRLQRTLTLESLIHLTHTACSSCSAGGQLIWYKRIRSLLLPQTQKTSVAEPYDLQSHAVYWIRPTKVFALRKKPFSVSCSTTPESKQTPTTPFQKEEGVCKKREGFQQTCVRHAFCIWAVTFQTSKQVDQVQKSFWCFGECTALRCKSKISDPRPSRLCMLLLLLDRMHHLPFRWITIKRRKVNRATTGREYQTPINMLQLPKRGRASVTLKRTR